MIVAVEVATEVAALVVRVGEEAEHALVIKLSSPEVLVPTLLEADAS